MSSEPVAVKEATTYPRGFAKSTDWKWPMVPARQLVTLNYGRALKADTRRPGEIPVYGTNGQCGWHDTLLAKGPGLILGRKGQGPLGVEWCPTNFWVIDTAYYATTLTHGVDLKYLYHLIKHVGLNHLKDGTSNPTLSRDVFGAQLFPLPSLEEQRAITEVLDTLDDRIALLCETNATLEAIAQALFKSWFVDFDPVRAKQKGLVPEGMDEATAALFPDGFEESELGLVPKGWSVGVLGDLVVTARKQLQPSDLHAELKYVGLEHIPRKSLGLTAWDTAEGLESAKAAFREGDILFGKLRPYFHKVVVAPFDGVCSTDVLVCQPRLPDHHVLAVMLLSSVALIDYADRLSNGAKMPRVTWKDLAAYRIIKPPRSVAAEYNRIGLSLLEKIRANVLSTHTLANLRDALLPRLISGQVRLPEAVEFVLEPIA